MASSGVGIDEHWRGAAWRCLRLAFTLVAAAVAGGCGSNSAVTSTGPTQSKCQVTLASPSSRMGADGGTGSISVTTSPECPWDTAAGVNWISGLTPASGQGTGTVSFQVAPNLRPASRDGDVVVNDSRVTVSQQAAPCQFALAPASTTVAAAGGTPQLTVSSDSACSWQLTTDAAWITFATPDAGSGNGTVGLRIAPNAGLDTRVGTVAVGGVQATVTQPGATPDPTCSYAVTVTTVFPLPAAGGIGTIAVSTTPACTWTAQQHDGWIAITSGSNGNGDGTVTFTVDVHNGKKDRTGTMTIAGQTVTVLQRGKP